MDKASGFDIGAGKDIAQVDQDLAANQPGHPVEV
jgi:hypothetical protein